tara:strand:- start:4201 stop:4779 length:579 start_codon:yes stop_codon:yes gene_type:complete
MYKLWIILCCCIGNVAALEGDASYSNTDGVVQFAGRGKHWFGDGFKVDGRYNKVEGQEDRFSYGFLSRHYGWGIVNETTSRVFDTHRAAASNIGLGGRTITLAVGCQREWPDGAKSTTLGTFTARLIRAGWSFGDGRGITVEGKYTYLTDGDDSRHDYRTEGRIAGKHIYVGARYEHARDVIIQGMFLGVKW